VIILRLLLIPGYFIRGDYLLRIISLPIPGSYWRYLTPFSTVDTGMTNKDIGRTIFGLYGVSHPEK